MIMHILCWAILYFMVGFVVAKLFKKMFNQELENDDVAAFGVLWPCMVFPLIGFGFLALFGLLSAMMNWLLKHTQ